MKCNEKCQNIKTISIFALIFLVIGLIIFISFNSPNTENKSILVAIARPGDNTQVGNAIINFSDNQIVEGTGLSHTPGSNQIMINEDGIYQISYQLEGDAQQLGRFNFNAILIVNNVPLEDTENDGPVITENIVNNRMTLTSTVILRLNAGDILQLGGLSLEDIIYSNARIDIEKIL